MSARKMKSPKKRKTEKSSWWLLSLAGLLVAGLVANVVYRTFRDIKVQSPEWKTRFHADFPGLEGLAGPERDRVVKEANREPCPCGCGYTLASCLKGDLNCPIRSKNQAKLREIIREAS
jgi:hypothetical protein